MTDVFCRFAAVSFLYNNKYTSWERA